MGWVGAGARVAVGWAGEAGREAASGRVAAAVRCLGARGESGAKEAGVQVGEEAAREGRGWVGKGGWEGAETGEAWGVKVTVEVGRGEGDGEGAAVEGAMAGAGGRCLEVRAGRVGAVMAGGKGTAVVVGWAGAVG